MNLYRQESSNPKFNAQRNLQGRTHYVDDATLRFHHSRILETHITDYGLLFGLVESVALDMHNTKRGFRPVIFDVFGNAIYWPELSAAHSTKKAAVKTMWTELNRIDAKRHTLQAIREHARRAADNAKQFAIKVKAL